MQKRELNRLLSVVFSAMFLFSFAAAYFVTDKINPLWVLLFALLYEQLYLIPSVVSRYSYVRGVPTDGTRFIPIWNEWQIFTPGIAKIIIWTFGLFMLLALLSLSTWSGLPLIEQLIFAVFGGNSFGKASVFIFLFTIISYIALVWVEGLGYSGIWRYLEREYPMDYGVALVQRGWDKVQYLVLFIPILRIVALNSIYGRLGQVLVFVEADKEAKESFKKIK